MIKLKKDNEKQKYVSPKIVTVVFSEDVLTTSDGYGVKWNESWSGSIKNLWDED